jgi:hypothetical protein
MKRTIAFSAFALALVFGPLAAARNDDALTLVPPDAVSVGAIRLSDLRASPLASKLFANMDHVTTDGEAARFLGETGLNPKEDVDLIVAAGSPKGPDGGKGAGLVIFEGRFDAVRLAAAVAARGAARVASPNGDYFLLPDKIGSADGAVAFVSDHLIVAGTESYVAQALAARAAGGSGFASGSGLGRHLSRIDSGATAWALVDMARFPLRQHEGHGVHVKGTVNGQPVNVDVTGHGDEAPIALLSAMKSVSLVALQATANGDSLTLAATGLSDDADTRELLEDAIRGVLAAWRIGVQDTQPDMVSVLRKFKVVRDGHGVSISGTLPGPTIRAMTEGKKKATE